ncbi:dihydrolipoyllysine-residue acetyltransferase [Ketobacter alkanivorans]|uniref:Acetyltransferase component of pyruvate dehydrogenase complex n=1 Tax=Ketobacter alkanivorans TaxID=1917421 RepID=A0A2K9LPF0_9GAMM|nr:dihydrolipoyllysine-residue acetyltransferase [Ketobacter alkanivorans]AUM14117.1 dihydrolipoyllysine-residue acetyltransferase [Ketobacter alkanivorans]
MAVKDVLVPDLGGTDGVDVIELSVQPGDRVEKEDTLLVLESDKATVEVPSPFSGVVSSFSVSIGQTVKEGDVVAQMEVEEAGAAAATSKPKDKAPEQPAAMASSQPSRAASETAGKAEAAAASSSQVEVVAVPDIGGAEDVEVIEVSVQEGDQLEAEQTMVVLESDKATMEVPCPTAGTVRKVLLKVGDKVSQGASVLELLVVGKADVASAKADSRPAADPDPKPVPKSAPKPAPKSDIVDRGPSKRVHAGPAVRRLARELGADLAEVKASGPRARILKEDVHAYVKGRMQGKSDTVVAGSGLPPLPEIDFTKWGEVETVELGKINKLSAANLHRSWVHIPHVTQFDEADITSLEAFRKAESAALKEQGVKLTLLAFMVKACAKALQAYPRFNSSLNAQGTHLIFKQYVNIGIAVDTPNGLVVPVIRDADKKSVTDIAKDMQTLSEKARAKKLSPGDMQGGCFSISSLGGIGGTAFTPIVNWPEVSILGVSRSQMKPVYNGKDFEPRLMVPLSLSYDHRVIDGAEAARFTTYLSELLSDIRRLLL